MKQNGSVSRFTRDKDSCLACHQTVSPQERMIIGDSLYHRGCFRCSRCSKPVFPLPDEYFTGPSGRIYCKTHRNDEDIVAIPPAAQYPPEPQGHALQGHALRAAAPLRGTFQSPGALPIEEFINREPPPRARSPQFEAMVTRLHEMCPGISRELCAAALEHEDFQLERALDSLLRIAAEKVVSDASRGYVKEHDGRASPPKEFGWSAKLGYSNVAYFASLKEAKLRDEQLLAAERERLAREALTSSDEQAQQQRSPGRGHVGHAVPPPVPASPPSPGATRWAAPVVRRLHNGSQGSDGSGSGGSGGGGNLVERMMDLVRSSSVQTVQVPINTWKEQYGDISWALTKCLGAAIENGSVEMMIYLIQQGANPGGPPDAHLTPLELAVSKSQLPCARLLVEHFKAHPNRSCPRVCPLQRAIKDRCYDLAAFLISAHADVNRVDENGRTPLHAVAEVQDYGTASRLLEAGADIRIGDKDGHTALHTCFRMCKRQQDRLFVCLLLDKTREARFAHAVNAQTHNGNTILHIACARRDVLFLTDLAMTYNADPFLTNSSGKLPLDVADTAVQPKIREYMSVCRGRTSGAELTSMAAPAGSPVVSVPPAVHNTPTSPSKGPATPVRSTSGRNLSPAPVSLSPSLQAPPYSPPLSAAPSRTPAAASSAFVPATPPPAPATPAPPTPAALPPLPVSPAPPDRTTSSSTLRKPTKSQSEEMFDASLALAMRASLDPASFGGEEVDRDWSIVDNFRRRIEELILNDGFEREFEEIESLTADASVTSDFSSALLSVNNIKNRYKNILPFESTRVRLQPIDGIEGSDYFSANWIKVETSGSGEGAECTYICTQGPLPNTVSDFWRMIWETNASVIVMLAKEVELGKEKVYHYWPDAAPMDLQGLIVSKTAEYDSPHGPAEPPHTVVRHFSIYHKKTGRARTVYHFHFIAWPDQGLPDHTDGFTKMVDMVDEKQNKSTAPIVVHCSAGIGRSGTFCVYHNTLAKLKLLLSSSIESDLNIRDVVLRLRQQRAGMVQTKEQYVFCYLSIVDKLTEILRLLEYKKSKWFYKSLDSAQANQLLAHEPNGTFLFRGSSAPGFIVLSAVNGNNVVHARISVTARGFQMEDDLYPNLTELVKARSKVLIRPLLRKS